jgi:hypothetical protein
MLFLIYLGTASLPLASSATLPYGSGDLDVLSKVPFALTAASPFGIGRLRPLFFKQYPRVQRREQLLALENDGSRPANIDRRCCELVSERPQKPGAFLVSVCLLECFGKRG